MRKDYSQLSFTDDFMFCKILTNNNKLCKELLELILNIKIKKIEYSQDQKTMDVKYNAKGIRLDVYAEDEANTIYDLEMQTTEQKDLPKRMRYYQGMIDLNLIEKGKKYRELKKSYVVFICLSDPFGLNEAIYSFSNVCTEHGNILLGDESYKVVINASGKRDGLSEQMKEFLDYLQYRKVGSSISREIENEVETAIEHKKWEVEYMTMAMKLREEREDGMARGMIKAFRVLNAPEETLIRQLMDDLHISKDEAQEKLDEYDEEEDPEYDV